MKHQALILFIISQSLIAYSNQLLIGDSTNVLDDEELEKLVEYSLVDDENSTDLEDLEELKNNPIDINQASIEVLSSIPYFDQYIISQIIERRKAKKFQSIDDLKSIDGITDKKFLLIEKYISVNNVYGHRFTNVSLTTRVFSETAKRRGYVDKSFYGNPYKILNKVRATAGNDEVPLSPIVSSVNVGIITEKDAGEGNLLDFYSGYASLRFPILNTNLILGDYKIENAEGLVFWQTANFSKGYFVNKSFKNGQGISPYTSSNENKFFRGVGVSLGDDIFRIQLMYSNKWINASVDTNENIISFDQSGLFRNQSELKRKNSSKENLIGYNLFYYLSDELRIGASGYKVHYLHPLMIKEIEIKPLNNIYMNGFNIYYLNSKFHWFTEIAMDYSKSIASISGINYYQTKFSEIKIIVRNYPKNFLSLFGNSYRKVSNEFSGEKGIYFGILLKPFKRLFLSAYYDQYILSQLSSRLPVPSNGNDFLALTEYKVTKSFEISLRMRYRNTPSQIENMDKFGRTYYQLTEQLNRNYRITLKHNYNSNLLLTNKLEWVDFKEHSDRRKETGFLISQAIKYALSQSFIISAKISMFETFSYNSRIYDYEEDMPGVLTNSALYGKGIKSYILLRYNLGRIIFVHLKYSYLIKEGVKFLGSGEDQVSGNSQGYVSAQLEIKL